MREPPHTHSLTRSLTHSRVTLVEPTLDQEGSRDSRRMPGPRRGRHVEPHAAVHVLAQPTDQDRDAGPQEPPLLGRVRHAVLHARRRQEEAAAAADLALRSATDSDQGATYVESRERERLRSIGDSCRARTTVRKSKALVLSPQQLLDNEYALPPGFMNAVASINRASSSSRSSAASGTRAITHTWIELLTPAHSLSITFA